MNEDPKVNLALNLRKDSGWFCYRQLVKQSRTSSASILLLKVYEAMTKKEPSSPRQYGEDFLANSGILERRSSIAGYEHSFKEKPKTQEICHYITIHLKEKIDEEWSSELFKKLKSSKKYRSPTCQLITAETSKDAELLGEKDDAFLRFGTDLEGLVKRSEKNSVPSRSKREVDTFTINDASETEDQPEKARCESSLVSKANTDSVQVDLLKNWVLVERQNGKEINCIPCITLSDNTKALLAEDIKSCELEEYDALMAEFLLDKRKRIQFYKDHREEFRRIKLKMHK